MAGPIQYNELFNNDVQAKLAELQSLVNTLDSDFQGLSKTISGMSGRIGVSIKSNTQSFKDLESSVNGVNVASKGATDSLVSYGKAVDSTAKQTDNLKTQQSGLDKIFDISSASVDELKNEIKQLTAEYNSLGRATDQDKAKAQALATQVQKLKAEQDNLSTALNKTKTALQASEGSYTALNNRLNQLRKDLKDMPGAINEQTGAWNKANPAVKRYLDEINKLDTTLKKVDATLGNHQRNVGNYSSALSGVGNQLTSLVAGYVTIQGAMALAGRAFDSALQTDAIRTVLEFTFKSADVAQQKLDMLRSTADRLGVGYIALANTYKSFTAAAMASNYPIAQAEKIFLSVANAGAKLRLTSDQMSGALLALQQMISKGTVQAEELRGQLGERLPGAFSIAARAMGVTEKELGKMLQKGEVLASDLLPKLATELDKTFGSDSTKRIDNLQSSWSRLTNSFDLAVEGGNISKFFKFLVDGTNNWLSSLNALVNSKSFVEFFQNLNDYATFGLFKKSPEGILKGATQAFPGSAGTVADNGIFGQAAKAVTESKITKDPKKTAEEEKNALEKLREEINKITLALQLQALAAIQAKKAYAPDPATIKLLNDLQDQLGFAERGGRDKQIDYKAPLKGGSSVSTTSPSLTWMDDLSKLTDPDIARQAAPLMEMQKLLDAFAEAERKGQKDITEIYSIEIQKRLDKTAQAKQGFMDAMEVMKQSSQVIGEIFGQEFGNLFANLTTNLEDFVLDGKVGFEDMAMTAIAGVRSINEAFQQGSELRIEKLNLEKQAQIDIAGTNKDARLNIEKEYNSKIREEKIKQAKIDKTAAVFEIGINTAIAVSKTLAETALFGIPLIPIIIGLGIAQIAAVLARPLPQFRHGTKSSPEGLAEVAEDGAEAIQDPSGKMRIAHKRQVTYLKRGSKVFTASETKRMMDIQEISKTTDVNGRLAISLNDRRREDQIQTMAAAFYASRISEDAIGQSVGREIAKLPITSLEINEYGMNKYIQTRTTRTKVLNDKYTLR